MGPRLVCGIASDMESPWGQGIYWKAWMEKRPEKSSPGGLFPYEEGYLRSVGVGKPIHDQSAIPYRVFMVKSRWGERR